MGVVLLVSSPLTLLVRMGFLLGDSEAVVGHILGESLLSLADVGVTTIILIVVQILLSLGACVVTYIFISKVLNAMLKDDDESYFRTLYKIFFLLVLIIPEVISIITIFVPAIPLKLIMWIDLGIAFVVFLFTTILAEKILPDLMECQNKKFFFGENHEN